MQFRDVAKRGSVRSSTARSGRCVPLPRTQYLQETARAGAERCHRYDEYKQLQINFMSTKKKAHTVAMLC